ncbi:MAG: GNAT family N-acetyltransferase [Clostridia bacterium]|nr:GNAT family N-acetyltransferase [Clostridia bacterium]
MILETERLILRPWQEADAEDLYKYASSDEVGPIAGWPAHTSVENSLDIIRNVLSLPETYAVVDKATKCAIGSVGLKIGKVSDLDIPETEAEIGYWLGVEFWGRGLIPEAVKEIIRYAFEDLNLQKIWCGYYDGNIKSKRVQEKCGFEFQFTKNDVYCSLLEEIRMEHITCLTKEKWQKADKRTMA